MDFKSQMAESDKLMKAAVNMTKPAYEVDERFWDVTLDAKSNGAALIRFLPQKDFSKPPSVSRRHHAFKLDGKYFFEYCPYTIGKSCPHCEIVAPIWSKPKNARTKDDEAQIAMHSSKQKFISNIIVLNDTAKPENNGKVFLFQYTKTIASKIAIKITPEVDFEKPINPYDFKKGCNFKYIKNKLGEWPNYTDSAFYENTTPLHKDDTVLEKIWNQLYDLDEFVDPKLFKSYEKYSIRLNNFLKNKSKNDTINNEIVEDVKNEIPDFNNHKTIDEPEIQKEKEDVLTDDIPEFEIPGDFNIPINNTSENIDIEDTKESKVKNDISNDDEIPDFDFE